MTTALIKKMKNTLGLDRHTLKMLADTSRLDNEGITIMTEERKENGGFTRTSGVNMEKLTQYLCETFGDDHEAPIKLDVHPLMLQQLCHNNSIDFAKAFDMDVCVGFNVTACVCGDFMSFEIHSVPVDKDGKYYDITEDFCGEKEKWFIPINTIPNKDLKTLMWRIRQILGNSDGYCYSQKNHTCLKAKNMVGKTRCYAPYNQNEAITKKKDVVDFFDKCKELLSVIVMFV
jgi:hypothetical protein